MGKKETKVLYERKSHFCIFCKKEVPRASEHFLRKHRTEDAVKDILKIENKRERYWAWKRLAQEGDNYYNINIVDSPKARKIVKKPLTKGAKKYFTCETCLSRIRVTSRRPHRLACNEMLRKGIPSVEEVQEVEEDLFEGLPEDIINKVKESQSLVAFLQHCFEVKENKHIVRAFLRDLLSLEEIIQEKNKSKRSLISYLSVDQVDNFVTAIKSLSEQTVTSKEKMIRYPHKALRICRLINELCIFMISYYSKRNIDRPVMEITKFNSVFQMESEKKIKKVAVKAMKVRKLKNPVEIPKTSHISILVKKLKKETPELMSALKKKQNTLSWKNLAENILCRLTVFNRRRGGAIEKMKISEYNSTEIKSKVATEEALFDLDKEDEEFLNNLKVVEIIHKCNNIVPIYINKPMQDAIDLLIKYRDIAGIKKENEYVFAAGKNSLGPMRGGKALEKYRQCFPEAIRKLFTATKLRKHGATITQLLDLSLQDKQEWADHLGHSVKVHDTYYRNKELVNGILKTGRILSALDEGILKYFKGKKVTDISLRKTQET